VPIRWSASKVREATDKAEQYIGQIKEPMASVKAIAEEALEIPEIPEYIKQGFRGLISEVERSIGGVSSFNQEPYPGSLDKTIKRIRGDIPGGAVEQDQASRKYGSTPALV